MFDKSDQYSTLLQSNREWSLLWSSVRVDSLLIRVYRREHFKLNNILLNQYYLQTNIINR